MMEDWQDGGFGLYLHWPFCQSKCPYCDFNSHVATQIDQSAWRDAYLAEIGRAAGETPNRILRSVFFGGGTPSLMDPDVVAAVLDRIRQLWPMANQPEITLEANPGSVEAGRFAGYRQAGVNRVSMGVQSLRDEDLRKLGRLHSAAEARKAFDIARTTFDRVSFDLIYARQDQSLADWRAELAEALSMAVDHLSLYQLTIEDGTAFGDRAARGLLRGLPDEDLAADMWDATQDMCENAGRPAYETSNHAVPGAESQHNLVYWRSGDWVGVGPGAHGRLTLGGTRWATETERNPARWLSAVQREGSGEKPRHIVPPAEWATEYLLMGLRLTEGVDLRRHDSLAPAPFDRTRVAGLVDLGLVRLDSDQLIVTAKGRPLLNAILREVA